MPHPETVEDRVAELEARLTIQQRLLDELSEVLWRQQREAGALLKRVTLLERRLSEPSTSNGGGGEAPPDELPPHY
jgi:SlyX protein